jgi:hypothetical protein
MRIAAPQVKACTDAFVNLKNRGYIDFYGFFRIFLLRILNILIMHSIFEKPAAAAANARPDAGNQQDARQNSSKPAKRSQKKHVCCV